MAYYTDIVTAPPRECRAYVCIVRGRETTFAVGCHSCQFHSSLLEPEIDKKADQSLAYHPRTDVGGRGKIQLDLAALWVPCSRLCSCLLPLVSAVCHAALYFPLPSAPPPGTGEAAPFLVGSCTELEDWALSTPHCPSKPMKELLVGMHTTNRIRLAWTRDVSD